MKYEKTIYGAGCLILIGASLMKILHLPYANGILQLGFVCMFVFQAWTVAQLKKRVKELENGKLKD